MDESLVKAVSQHMGVPETLVSRSAEARAQANNSDVNDVLNAWLGGSSVEIIETETPEVEEAKEPVVNEDEIVEEEITDEAIEDTTISAQEESVAYEEEFVDLIVEELPPPVGLSIKLYKSLKIGAIFGIVTGLFQAFLLGNTLFEGVYLDQESFSVISQYSVTKFILTISISTAVCSMLNLVISKKMLDSSYEGFGIETSDRESIFLGIGTGLAFGAICALIITSSIGTVVEGVMDEDPTLTFIPVFKAIYRVAIFSIIIQIIITSLGQVFGIPKGLQDDQRSEVVLLRNRINGSILLPLGAIMGGGIFAFLISRIFINFHSHAPLLGIVISAAILFFAGLISSAPNIKVTKTEIWVAIIGILTLIVIVSSIAYVQH